MCHHFHKDLLPLIQYSISNAVTLYGLAPLYITNWQVLNESIQTLRTETGSPFHSPYIHKESSGRRVFPSGPGFLSTSGKSAAGFQYSGPNIRPT